MFKKTFSFFLLGIYACILLACSSCKDSQPISYDQATLKKQIEEVNKKNAKRERLEIAAYVKKNDLQVKKTGTGLEYEIYYEGSGKQAEIEALASIHYSIYLLNDSLLYTSRDKEPARFRIGKSSVETGLHEGILLMKEGDKARMFLPSHLAHGAFGDQKKVPPQTPLLYDIELISLN